MKKLFPVLIFLFGIIIGLINIEITNKDFINILVDYSLPKTKKELSYKLLTSKLINYKENTLNYLMIVELGFVIFISHVMRPLSMGT